MERSPQESIRDSQEQQTKSLIVIHRQRLDILRQQAAQLGLFVPPHIQLEIDAVEKTIAELEDQLALSSHASIPVPPVDLIFAFNPAKDGTTILTVRGHDGSAHTMTFVTPWSEDRVRYILYVLRTAVRSLAPPVRSTELQRSGIDAREIGHMLYTTVFSDPVKEMYKHALEAAEGRVRLIVASELPHIARLPWELLHNGDDFVSLDRDTPVVRGVLVRPRTVTQESPLRVLMIGATPAGEELGRIEAEREIIERNLEDAISRGAVVVETLIGADVERELPSVLGRFRPHLLHIAGHGSLSGLRIEGVDGRSRQLTINTLVRLLRNVKSVQMVVINGGEFASTTEDDLGLAPKLVRVGIPAIVGMQFEVSDVAALAFAEGYYQALGWNWPIQEAVIWARSQMIHYAPTPDVSEWITPVVYIAIGEISVDPDTLPEPSPKQVPLSNEAIYRGLLELIWEDDVVSDGDQRRLEQKRVNLGISAERALVLEREVRFVLAQAALTSAHESLSESQLEKAREWFRRALVLDPDNEVALQALRRWAYWPDALRPISHETFNELEQFWRIGLSGRIFATAWSPNGESLALATEAGLVLYDTETLQIKFKLSDSERLCYSVAWSPDSRFLAAGDDNGMVRVWDLHEQRRLPPIHGPRAHIHALSFNPAEIENPMLAIGDNEGNISLWSIKDVLDGKKVQPTFLEGHGGSIYSLAWSHDGHVIASGANDRHIHVVQPGSSGRVILKGHADWVRRIAWSPDGQYMASSSGDQTVCVWNWPVAVERNRLRGHSGWVRGLAWSCDGSILLSGGGDGLIRIWNPLNGKELRTLGSGDLGLINDMSLHPNGQVLAVGSFDGELTLWSVPPHIEDES